MSIKPLTDVDIRRLVSSCGGSPAAEQFALSYVTLRTAYEGAVGHNASLASMATSAEQDRHVANTLLTAVTLERDEARIKLQAAVDASEVIAAGDHDEMRRGLRAILTDIEQTAPYMPVNPRAQPRLLGVIAEGILQLVEAIDRLTDTKAKE